MWRSTEIRTVLALAGVVLATAGLQPAGANEVLKWNETATKAAAANGQNPIQTTRTIAMVQGAVHDALNAITPRYAAYYYEAAATAGASPDAAVAAAAYTVLAGVVPNFGAPPQKTEALALVEEAYKNALGNVRDETARTRGVAVGTAAGEAMLALRKDDGATKGAPYTPSTAPGRWRPHPNPDPPNPPIKDPKLAPGMGASTLPGWGNVTPFTLLSASQFWLPGPPALNSAAYARDFNEVKSIGGQVSTVRTAEQTDIARFWFEGPGSWYRLTRAAAEARALDPWDSARVLALVSLAMADSYISGFKIRYVYDMWRPVTAIREADTDGNDATIADASWNSLQNTPVSLRLSLHAKPLQRGRGGGARERDGHGPGSGVAHERSAFCEHQALLHELLAGRAGERGLTGLCGHPLPYCVRRRPHAGTQDRRACGFDVPSTPAEGTSRGALSATPPLRPAPRAGRRRLPVLS